MKATLEFDLDNPDDRKAHLRCVKSTDMAIVLFELRHNSKKRVQKQIEKGADPIDAFYNEFFDLLDENGVVIDDLID